MASSSSSTAPVELFSTSILSNHKVRSRHERYLSILTVKKIPFVYHDLASDEEAKSRWRRKARDPQIPGLLVHNEWRGTFDEFEEAVEFGELDLFLRIEAGGSREVAAVATTETEATLPPQPATSVDTKSSKADVRAPSHSVKLPDRLAQPRAPSTNNLAPALPFAPSGSGFRKEHDAESFLSSLGISDLNLTEEELNEILEEGKDANGAGNEDGRTAASSNGERGNGKYPTGLGLGTSKPAVARTYIPSAEAGIKPLRLARMGEGIQNASLSTSPLRTAASARFNASQLSSKALAAEAQASISSRSFSSIKLREAVSKGDKLEDAFQTTRNAEKEHVVGREDLDDLMASLGLSDVKMSDEEAEAFLMDGTIPAGLDTHGQRLGRAGSVAERARNEAAARDVAKKAKEKGYGSENSRPTSVASSSDVPDLAQEPNVVEETKEERRQQEVDEREKTDVAKLTSGNEKQDGEKVEQESPTRGEEAVTADPEEGSKAVDIPSIEATPLQRSVDLPTASSDSDQTKGKSSTSSVATLLKVEVQAPSDDLDAALQKAREDVPKDDSSGANEGDAVNTLGSTESAHMKDPVDSSEAGQKRSKDEGTVSNEIADDHTDVSEVKDVQTKHSQVANVNEHTVEEGLSPPKKDAPLPQVPLTATVEEAPSPPSKSLSPPFSPTPTSPPVDKATLSPMLITTSPTTSRRPPDDASITPRRRAMDLTRSMSSSSSLSEATSPHSTSSRPHASSPINSEGLKSPKSLKSPKTSPRNGTKKFFGLGRRKDKDRSRRGEQEEDSDEEPTSMTTSSSSPPLPSAGNNARGQKTLSMILREADEALNGVSDDEDGLGHSHDDEGAFSLELDDVDGEGGLGIEA